MWRKRQKKNNRHFFARTILFLAISLLVLSVGLFSFSQLFPNLWFIKSTFVSPIPTVLSKSNKQDSQDRNIATTQVLQAILLKNNIPFSSTSLLSDSSYLVQLIAGEEVLLSSKKPLASQISSLQLLLSRFTIEGKRFTRLDLRFDKPIAVFR